MRSILLIFLLIKLICTLSNVGANEVLGCGGFIKSHADHIDFSKVEIKLFTKQGSLKDKTDCTPHNGYYFLPIYDKGEYLLRISPPSGWSFEPSQVELNFDGKTDICSQGKDVNFVFKGFGITGKVSLAGRSGAKGVDIQLRSEDGTDVRQTISDVNGIFSFTPIIPGKYIISASHARWHFSKAEAVIIVKSGNTEIPENSLVVSGFDVEVNRCLGATQMTSGFGVAIFRKKGQTLPMKCKNTDMKKLAVTNENYENTSACYCQLDKSGDCTFEAVPPGTYLMQPVVDNSDLTIHIAPQYIEFDVLKDTLQIKDEFKITGFSVSGQVLSAEAGGSPIADATIKLNGQKTTQTDASGKYLLQNVKAGSYSLQVESPKMIFNEQQIKIQLSSPKLPIIVPSSFEVCGKIVSKKSYVVGFTKHGSTFHTTASSKSDSDGEWCVFLPPGIFTVEVLTTDADKDGGVKFFPVQQNIEVKTQPLTGIVFSQLRANLSGKLNCLTDSPSTCLVAEVTLHTLDHQGQATGKKQVVNAKDGKYSFKDILPGPYEITIPQYNLCFDSTRVLCNVASAVEEAPDFVQRGYEVSIIASHRSIMKYSYISTTAQAVPPVTDTIKLLSGVNTFCVPKFGSYSIKLEGCHLFDDSLPKTFNTADASPLVITAVSHKLGIRILSSESEASKLMKLNIESPSLGKQVIVPKAEAHKVDGKFALRYDFHLKPEEVLKIIPQSDVLLFSPSYKEIKSGKDCVDIAFNFIATRGLILQGTIKPAIKDAKITLSFPKNPEINSQIILSSTTGEFKFGPIDESLEYELSGEKESYVFSEYNRVMRTFSVHKLCEIIVKVKDESGKELSGVLLSLSAESYRKNLVTGENGNINFHSLSPSKYFLRPMMKEYKFEPNSKTIDIKDGETIEVNLIGKRVAYSVFGDITSINGEPFPKINIEAISDEDCMHHQEEAVSEQSGQYRIRGLQPGCRYSIRAKDIETANPNVVRTIPESRIIKVDKEDIRGINLISISAINFVDVLVRVTAPLNEHYKTLRLTMYRKGVSDSPIYSQRVETPLNPKASGIMIFLPRIPLDGKTYFIELKSTLSTTIVEQFVASDTSSIYVELNFKPEVKTAEPELNQNSISALVLVALVAIAFFKQDIAMDFLNFLWSRINGIAQDIAQKQKNLNKKDTRRNEHVSQREIDQIAFAIDAIKKKKPKKI